MWKPIVILSILLALSLIGNAWQYKAAHEGTSDAKMDKLREQLKAQTTSEIADYDRRTEEELRLYREDGERKVAESQRAEETLAHIQEQDRNRKMKEAQSSPTAMRNRVVMETGVDEIHVKAQGDGLVLDKVATVTWLDMTLKLKDGMTAADGKCETRLATLRLELEPSILLARQETDRVRLEWEGDKRIRDAEEKHLEAKLRAARSDLVLYTIGAGVAGVLLGAGGIMVWQATR